MWLEPWTSEHVRLAQQHENLWVRIYWDGTPFGSILDVRPVEGVIPTGAAYWVRVHRGVLVMNTTDWVLISGTRLGKRDAIPIADRKPVDNVSWEIHRIEDPDAYHAARSAYIASRSRLVTNGVD